MLGGVRGQSKEMKKCGRRVKKEKEIEKEKKGRKVNGGKGAGGGREELVRNY